MKEREYEILKFFSYKHLPEHLQKVSMPFYKLARKTALIKTNDPAEIATSLRKLLESKDCAVRAALD